MREKVSSSEITVETEQGETGMSNGKCDVLGGEEAGDRGDGESETTMKYRPDFPVRFGELEHARMHTRDFMAWYNDEHHHAELGMLTPADVHHGRADQRSAERQLVLDSAFEAHPERFPKGRPAVKALAREVWINKPSEAPGAARAHGNAQLDLRAARAVTGAVHHTETAH